MPTRGKIAGAGFCTVCGEETHQSAKTGPFRKEKYCMILCPRCGRLNEPIASICVNCGQPLAATTSPNRPPAANAPTSPNQAPSPGAYRLEFDFAPPPPKPAPSASALPEYPIPNTEHRTPNTEYRTPNPELPRASPAPPVWRPPVAGAPVYPAQPMSSRHCLVCGFRMMAMPQITACPVCATPVGMIADPNDPTCSNYLPYTGKRTPLQPILFTPARTARNRKK